MPDHPLIFLVDDDSDFLDLEKAILRGAGYVVECFADPRTALAALSTAPRVPSLIVTDLMMRNLNSGFTLAGALKADPRFASIPVIIVSAVARQKGFDFKPRSADDLSAMKAEAFFDKPVDPDAFLAKVRELLP
jgi:CheY-like chemotaxis protein